MKTVFLLESGRRNWDHGGETGITAVVSDFVASASVSPSQKHCAKAHCVFCAVIYVMAVVASGDCSLSVISLKYWSGLNLYILSSFHPRSVVDIAARRSINKEHNSFYSKFLQESIILLKEPHCYCTPN